jgi:hypothetical protein
MKTFWHYLLETGYLKTLTHNTVRELADEMANIEDDEFADGWAVETDSLIEDSEYPGFYGVGIFDPENTIVGYVFGYDLEINEVEITDNGIKYLDPEFKAQIENSGKNAVEYMIDLVENNKTFYTSNMVVRKANRYDVFKMIKEFISGLRAKGYAFMVFDALKDTQHLFLMDNGQIKSPRLEAHGLKCLATCRDSLNRLVTLFSI